MAPKRKRNDRQSTQDEVPGRPSPHRPQELNLAQQNQHQSVRGGRGGGGRGNSRRSSRQDFPPSSPSGDVNSTPVNASRRNARAQQSQQGNGVESPKAGTPSQRAETPVQTPQPQPAVQQSEEKPRPPVAYYYYEHVTDEVLESWQDSGRHTVVEAFKASDAMVASELLQELMRSGLDGRLDPAEAGAVVSQMITESKELDAYEESEISENFVDTIALLDDSDTKNPSLIHIVAATGIAPEVLRESLDVSQLQSMKLVRSTFDRMKARKTTNQLYRQANFNLLREETEGYAKLITEFFNMAHTRASTNVTEDAFQRVKALVGAFDLDVGRVLDIILDESAASLVREYRFTVKFLRGSSWWPEDPVLENIKWEKSTLDSFPRWALPGSTSWGYTEDDRSLISTLQENVDVSFWDRAREHGIAAFFDLGGRPITNYDEAESILDTAAEPELDSKGKEVNEDKRKRSDHDRLFMKATKMLPPRGNPDAAQLLGFKLSFYASEARDAADTIPENLIHLSALLIKVGFISLRDLYPHLHPADAQMPEERKRLEKEAVERKRKERGTGPANALAAAGALVDDTLPTSRRADAAKSGGATPRVDGKDTEPKEELPPPQNQKILLLKALLLVGALPEALFILGRFPWLVEVDTSLPAFLHRIVNHMLSKLANATRPLQDRTGLQAGKGSCPEGQDPAFAVQRPTKRTLRHLNLDQDDDGSGLSYKFYYDDWTINIPVCQSVEDVFVLCNTFVGFLGVKIGQDTLLLSRLLRWARQSLDHDRSETNMARWLELMKRLLVPALSLTDHNPSLNNEVWHLLQLYPQTTRYNVYAEWYRGRTSRLPDMMYAFAQAQHESLKYMRRISGESVTLQGRALWKATLCSPGIVLQTIVSQLESYSNMVPYIVESMRFMNNFGFDILTWHLINALSGAGRERMQGDGMLTSPWLKALARFTSLLFGRYSFVNSSPMLQYVCSELRQGDSTDLELLEQILVEMAGIKADYQPNDVQIKAMTQGRKLREETMKQLEDTRFEKAKSVGRLMKALLEPNLTAQLLLALEQERKMYPHHEDNGSTPLKVLGSNMDKIQTVVGQYLEVLQSNLAPSDWATKVPDVTGLIGNFGVPPAVALTMHRDAISARIADADEKADEKAKMEARQEAKTNGDGTADTQMTDSDGANAIKDEEMTTTSSAIEGIEESSPWHQMLKPYISAIPELKGDLVERISIPFYVTFWTLNAKDILWFPNAYKDDIKKVGDEIAKLRITPAGLTKTEKNDREKKRRSREDVKKGLEKEQPQMIANRERTTRRLKVEKMQWFPDPHENKGPVIEQRHSAILMDCFVARAQLSPMDALFSVNMLEVMHKIGTPGFRVISLLHLLFQRTFLATLIRQCTSKDSENLGRFLAGVLKWLDGYHKSKDLYEKEGLGKGSSNNIIGFARKVDENGIAVNALDHEDFRRILFNFHASLNGALKLCFQDPEYMHIYNGMNVLRAVIDIFPQLNFMGTDMTRELNRHVTQDERKDLKLAAIALNGTLKKGEKKWVAPQFFRIPPKGSEPAPSATKQAAKSGTTQPSTTTASDSAAKLNAKAPEFKPSTNNGDARKESVAEDGEIKDEKIDTNKGDLAVNTQPIKPEQRQLPKRDRPTVRESGKATPQPPAKTESASASKPSTPAPPTLPAKPLPTSSGSVRDASNKTPLKPSHDLPSKPNSSTGPPQSAPPQRPLPQPPSDRRPYDSTRPDLRSRQEASYGQPPRERSPARSNGARPIDREREYYASRGPGDSLSRYPASETRYSQDEYYNSSRRDQGPSRSQYSRGERPESAMGPPPTTQGTHPDRAPALQAPPRDSPRSATSSAPPTEPSNGTGPAVDPARMAMINKSEDRSGRSTPSANQERLGTRDRSSRHSDYGASRQESSADGKPAAPATAPRQPVQTTNTDEPPTGPRSGRSNQSQRDILDSTPQSGRLSDSRARPNQGASQTVLQESSYGRLDRPQDMRMQDAPPAGPRQPSGPASQTVQTRGRGFANASAATQPAPSPRAPESPAVMRAPPQEPMSRRTSGQTERQTSSSTLASQSATTDNSSSNVHPSRQPAFASQPARLQTSNTQGSVSASAGSPMSGHAPSGPRNGPQPPSTPTSASSNTAGPPVGPGGQRRSERTPRNAINNVLQSNPVPPINAGQGVNVRGSAAAAYQQAQQQMQPPAAPPARPEGPRDSAPQSRPDARQDLMPSRPDRQPAQEQQSAEHSRQYYENQRLQTNNRAQFGASGGRRPEPSSGNEPPFANRGSGPPQQPQDDRRGRDDRGYSQQRPSRGDVRDSQQGRGNDYPPSRQSSTYGQPAGYDYDPRASQGMRQNEGRTSRRDDSSRGARAPMGDEQWTRGGPRGNDGPSAPVSRKRGYDDSAGPGNGNGGGSGTFPSRGDVDGSKRARGGNPRGAPRRT